MTASIAQLGGVKQKNKIATQIVLDAAAAAGITLKQLFGVGGGDHAGGLATDFMVYNDQDAGDWIAGYIWANRATLGVRWIIWRQRIKSINPRGVYGPPNQWNPMEDRGNSTQNHYDHVHVMWDSAPVKGVPAAPQPVPVTPAGGTYVVKAGDTLGAIASRLKVSVADLVRWNGLKDADLIRVGQPLKTKGSAGKAPTSGGRPWLIARQNGVYPDLLRPGEKDSTSVYLYQLALRRYLGASANKWNPSGATGYYGKETETMTGRVYLDLAKKQTRGGWLTKRQLEGKDPLPTWPGTGLLKALGLRNLGHS